MVVSNASQTVGEIDHCKIPSQNMLKERMVKSGRGPPTFDTDDMQSRIGSQKINLHETQVDHPIERE
jgi:hypothetical protein